MGIPSVKKPSFLLIPCDLVNPNTFCEGTRIRAVASSFSLFASWHLILHSSLVSSNPAGRLTIFMFEGELLKLKLNKFFGAGFASKEPYLLGKVGVQIKLVPGDSACTSFHFDVN